VDAAPEDSETYALFQPSEVFAGGAQSAQLRRVEAEVAELRLDDVYGGLSTPWQVDRRDVNGPHGSEWPDSPADLWVSTDSGSVSFAGVVLLLLVNIPRLHAVAEYACLSFAGTVLVADALIHLLPHSLEGADHDTMVSVGISATLGCMAVLAIPELLDHGHAHGSEGCEHQQHVQAFGWANLLTEMLHNFADGMSLGVAWSSGLGGGLAAALAVAVHELPQELGDFVVLRSAGFPSKVPSLVVEILLRHL